MENCKFCNNKHTFGTYDLSINLIGGELIVSDNYYNSAIVKIKFCPVCGRKLGGDNKKEQDE